MDRSTLQIAMAAMSDRKAVADEVANQLGIRTTTPYHHINGDGTPKAPGQALLDGKAMPKPARARKERQSA